MVDRGEDGSTITAGNKGFGDRGEDADVGLGPDLLQSLIDWTQPEVVDDLGILHSLTRSDVESSHIPSNVGVADDGDHPSHVGLTHEIDR